jgi:hypothetical protein
MTVTLGQGSGGASPSSPLSIPLGATTVNSTNPNNFPVYLKIAPGTATISNITIGGISQGAVVAGTFMVPANGNVNLSYTVSTPILTTFSTGLTPATSYPFTDPNYQQFHVQQYLQLAGVSPAVTDA